MEEIEGLVSVSIPFYNSESFLAEAIESVLAQSYTNWELFLINDGSLDRSREIALKYAARSSERIHILEHPGQRNLGLTCSRNLGVRNSRGEYLAFLDSDDVWLPEKLSRQVGWMVDHPEVGLTYGPSEYWYDWDQAASTQGRNHIPALAPSGVYLPTTLLTLTYPIGKYGAPCPSSFLVRHRALDRAGGFNERFNPQTHQLYEDLAFLTAMHLSTPVYVSDVSLEKYRRGRQSMWHRAEATSDEESARQFYFCWLRNYLTEKGVTDPNIWKHVRWKAWPYWLRLPPRVTHLIRRVANRLSR
jgi:glycosyltransferase involved in cell wall biosynthesis